MPLLRTVAESMSNNTLLQGVVEEVIDRESLLELLPFQKLGSKALVYNREETLSEGVYLDPNETIPEEASTVTEHVAKLKILIGDVDVDKFLDSTMSDTNSQRALQIAMKAKGMMRQFKRTLVQGDEATRAKEFDGIDQICKDTGMELAAGVNGAALDLAMLDELLAAVKTGADALMMRQGTLNALKQLWRLAGGNTGGMLQINNFGLMVPAHDGVPIIVNDWVQGDIAQGTNTKTASIYAIRFNEADGLHGLYGGENAGFSLEDIGTVQNKDATRSRLKWYHGLVLKSTQSMAALRGVTNV
jgi:hypothetical protein